ncbi:MAG TPA: hypothetical protein VFK87_02935 [Steroidobacteraceae bacterium]|nr:hypothetical protein [Steroidobacteraceae bacterium]
MANPGRDIHNMQADDVLAPRRQQEPRQLLEVLKKFRPTKIAIDATVRLRKLADLRYQAQNRISVSASTYGDACYDCRRLHDKT